MVKKIQVNSEGPSDDAMDLHDQNAKIIKLLEAIDWKLWEIYKNLTDEDAE